ncbi:putative periplasmic serine endoprotease DegP-like [Desulfamplus magnetovallimortis]|uniref:Probable periplasmic serine endoprotease DegP-like n=1 Tax=Desulfamplus magnetovallimortis TaxID=1246637 RepID=A0A1W1HCI0_9BACT|nr:DegQ family serine endoprotease [Desulfamplus magnetovallimortis]SLM30088.1 putative periplasmic serine endoprotease DegP-like [Desulfamplus magnetovallimortis]
MNKIMKTITMIFFVSLMMLPASCFAKSVPMVPASFSDLADQARPAVVNIRTVKNISGGGRVFNHFFGQPFGGNDMFREFMEPFLRQQNPRQNYEQNSLGSGFIVSKDGYIVTNNHVIEGADAISVKLYDDKEYDAEVVGRDPKTDLALIKIDADDLIPLKLGNSSELKVGTWVVAIGSPFGLEQTVTAGIVSAKGRILGSGPYDDFIQTDASINPGNSGGPLLNLDGEVVGINTAIIKSGQGIGFAIPSDLAKGIVDQLKDSGEVTRGWMGVAIQDITPELAEYYNIKKTEGVLVGMVYKDHPADKAGIKAGDIITKINDLPVKSSRELSASIAGHGVGENVTVTFIREGKVKTASVILAKRSESEPGAIYDETGFDDFGMKLAPLDDNIAGQFGYRMRVSGLVVTELEPDGKAAQSGIRVGDLLKEVNHRAVENIEQYAALMKQIDKGERVQLLFRRGNSSFIAIRLVK